MKAFLIDVEEGKANVVEIEPKLENYYSLLHCDYIDIAERQIEGTYLDFICDDEGLLKERNFVSCFDVKQKPMLVGSVLICRHDGEGNETSLSDEDVELIQKHLKELITVSDNFVKFYPVLTGLDY